LFWSDAVTADEISDGRLPWTKIAASMGNMRNPRDYCRRWVSLRCNINHIRQETQPIAIETVPEVVKEINMLSKSRAIREAHFMDSMDKNLELIGLLHKLLVHGSL
jgi:hypothetical protein